ncbi:nitrate- and nitrite sensing domain-containing protein [Candidatus Gracilibacteria bacterium]|nr:nitrate- and nitrite sensing domain-containing protein [Candidatus Gracilibacteria bacterium]
METSDTENKGFQISVRSLLLTLSAIPLFFILAFSLSFISTEYRSLNHLNVLIHSTDLSYQISEYVHEMQKERGATGGFVGSKGEEFQSILSDQREATDKERDILNKTIELYPIEELNDELLRNYNDAFAAYQKLEDHRAKVDTLDVSDQESIQFYTDHNAKMYNFVSLLTTLSEDTELNTIMSAYINFVEGKEKAGVERALMTNIFAIGHFRDDAFVDFNFLVHSQKTYDEIFHRYANSEQHALYEQVSSSDVFLEVERMREVAFKNGLPSSGKSNSLDVDSEYWFKTITAKINLLHDVELELASDLSDRAQTLQEEKEGGLMLSIIATLIAIFSMIALSFAFAHLLSKPIIELTSMINKISLGGLDSSPGKSNIKEIKSLINSINRILVSLKLAMQRTGIAQQDAGIDKQDQTPPLPPSV